MHVYIHMAADSCESIMAGQHNPIGKQAAGEAVRGSPLLAVLRQIRRFVPTLPICFCPQHPPSQNCPHGILHFFQSGSVRPTSAASRSGRGLGSRKAPPATGGQRGLRRSGTGPGRLR